MVITTSSRTFATPASVLDEVRGVRLIIYETADWAAFGLGPNRRGAFAIWFVIVIDREFV